MEIAEKVTMTVQQIIEFAKMVPGFMNLQQDDQIMLLKGGTCFTDVFYLTVYYELVSYLTVYYELINYLCGRPPLLINLFSCV